VYAIPACWINIERKNIKNIKLKIIDLEKENKEIENLISEIKKIV
jgi:hypothetical protein